MNLETPTMIGKYPMKIAVALLALTITAPALAQKVVKHPPKVPAWSEVQHFNVVISVENEAKMREFYGTALGLESLPDITLPPREGRDFEVTMFRYKVGKAELKFIPHEGLSSKPGGRDTATGIRMISIPVFKGDEIGARIESVTGQSVQWQNSTGNQIVWVRDPDDNEVELRWYPKSAPDFRMARLEVGITSDDLRRARDTYSQGFGLLESSSAQLQGFPGLTRQFQLGDTYIRLWDAKKRLPRDTGYTKDGYGFRYLQFVVRDIQAYRDELEANGVTILQEPTPLGDSATLMFVADSDGIVIECVGSPE